jgi:hypothetical protein
MQHSSPFEHVQLNVFKSYSQAARASSAKVGVVTDDDRGGYVASVSRSFPSTPTSRKAAASGEPVAAL